MKKRIHLLMVVLFLVVFAGAAQADVVDRIVAVVNEDIILLSELNHKMQPYEEKIRVMGYPAEKEKEMLARLREDLLRRLIDQRLAEQEAAKKGIVVTDEEVSKAIDAVKKDRGFTDEELKKALARDGLSMAEYQEQAREQLLRSKLMDYEVSSKIVITDEDIRQYYDSHKEEFAGEKRIHLRNLIMRFPSYAGPMEKAAVLKRMEKVYSQIKNGADFSEMARRFSESSLASDGGNLGLFKLDELAPTIRDAVSTLPAGGFTSILETDQGYQIFYVENIVETPPKTLKSVSNEIQSRLYKQWSNERFEKWVKELRERSHIKVIR